MNLSRNLTLKEATKSNTAERYGIDNQPNEEQLENLISLAENVFQPCRDYFNKAIYISSGLRSKELNSKIGGSSNSQHCKGEALDLDCDIFGGITNGELFDFISAKIDFEQLIWEFGDSKNPNWVHVSYVHGGHNRKRCLRARRDDNNKVYYEVIYKQL